MASLFDTDDEILAPAPDDLGDAEKFDGDELPDRIKIRGRLFMRSGSTPIYTNIEDADDDRIFEIDPDTGELCQWPDCD